MYKSQRSLSAQIDIDGQRVKVFITRQGNCSCSVSNQNHSTYRYYLSQGLDVVGLRFDGSVCVDDEVEALMVIMGKYREKIGG